jgi:hypothetical protein
MQFGELQNKVRHVGFSALAEYTELNRRNTEKELPPARFERRVGQFDACVDSLTRQYESTQKKGAARLRRLAFFELPCRWGFVRRGGLDPSPPCHIL